MPKRKTITIEDLKAIAVNCGEPDISGDLEVRIDNMFYKSKTKSVSIDRARDIVAEIIQETKDYFEGAIDSAADSIEDDLEGYENGND
jgi:hypothetical protein